MGRPRWKLAVVGIAAVSLVFAASVAAFTMGLTATQTFTVGVDIQASGLQVGYNVPSLTSWTSYSACTEGTAPAWTCPSPTGGADVYPGGVITYSFAAMQQGASPAPSLNVTAGSFTAYTTTLYWQQLSGAPSANPSLVGSMSPGLPPMTAGTWFQIWLDITIGSSAPAGSATFTLSFGA